LCGYFRPAQLPAIEQVALILARARPKFDKGTKRAFRRLPNRAGVQKSAAVAKLIDECPQGTRSGKPAKTDGQRLKVAIPRQ
jgi:hypothetical protein